MTSRRVAPAVVLRSASTLEPFARTPVGSSVLQAGIHSEAFLRRRAEHVQRLVTITTGLSDAAGRRRMAELERRRQLAPGRYANGSKLPDVHWHGSDHVDGSRPVVVLVNGWTASGLVWPSSVVDRLAVAHHVIRVDNRGVGFSRTAPAPFTVEQMADDVIDVLDAVGAGAATVVGLSMGGMIAQEVAIRHPARVSRLLLLGTRPPSPAAFMPAQHVVDAVMSVPRPDETFREFVLRAWSSIAGAGFLERDRAGAEELVDRIAERVTPRAGVLSQARAIAAWHGAQRLGSITAPTAVVHGRDDPLVPVGNGMRIAQLIDGAQYVELAGIGHLVPFEAPDTVVAAITGSG